MTKKKPAKRAAAKRAVVATPSITINQNIDARGLGDASGQRIGEILAAAADKARTEIVRLLCAGDAIEVTTAREGQAAVRFWKVGANGHVLPDDAKDWEGVYDASTRLIWGRKLLAGEHTHADAMKAAAAATLCGSPARAPTIQERLSIVDYSRVEPALDVSFFEPSEKNGWEWTSTVAAAPSGSAWGVNLGYGLSFRYAQCDRGLVRAVRAGQPIGFQF